MDGSRTMWRDTICTFASRSQFIAAGGYTVAGARWKGKTTIGASTCFYLGTASHDEHQNFNHNDKRENMDIAHHEGKHLDDYIYGYLYMILWNGYGWISLKNFWIWSLITKVLIK